MKGGIEKMKKTFIKKILSAVATVAMTVSMVVAPTMEPLPTAPVVETNPNKPQKVTEEEFLFDSSEVQTNPFEIKEDGVK